MFDSRDNNQRRLYSDLAWLWHLVSPLEDYLEETELFVEIIQNRANIPLKKMLHLGCGRGHNDFIFKRYFQITGVDISPEMLTWAKKLNPEVKYLNGDIREIDLKEEFDLVISVDSLDYLTSREDLEQVFRNASRHLKPNGMLMLMLDSTKETFLQNDLITYSNSNENELLTVIENRFDPDTSDSNYEITFIYLYRKNSELQIFNDRHLCGLFSKTEVTELLEKTGFVVDQIDYLPTQAALGGQEVTEQDIYPMFIGTKR